MGGKIAVRIPGGGGGGRGASATCCTLITIYIVKSQGGRGGGANAPLYPPKCNRALNTIILISAKFCTR